ncbi:MAG: nucleoside phosphorylase [Deltaproteobacteria bacterium]|nr:nucleoside phosphorylase [Deltaproteobacteria bacterium]MBW2063294.1 nucleoside phosphorylase [Deltaproteobacteria bacterium]
MATLSRTTQPEDEALIHPVRGKGDPHVSGDVLMVIVRQGLDSLLASGKVKSLARFDMYHFYIYQVEYRDKGTCLLCGPFTGAPHAVMVLEKMIALGAGRIWVTGWCGSLQPDLRIGDVLLPTRAVSEEGTSSHYPIGDRGPSSSPALNRRLEGTLKALDRPFRKGAIWSTDAPFRETRRKVEGYRQRGVLAVDMEMAALMTVAIFRKVELTGLLVVSDELFGGTWNAGFSSRRFREASEGLHMFMLEFLSS